MSKRHTNMAKNDSTDGIDDGGDAPLIDLNDASIKKLIARAKKRGVITYDELNVAAHRRSCGSLFQWQHSDDDQSKHDYSMDTRVAHRRPLR